ncbi:hypothetical protein Peur_048525 [Populus x canadensis]
MQSCIQRSCITNLLPGWFTGFFKISTVNLSSEAYSPTHLSDAIFLWVLSTKVGYMATSIFRQEDRDVEHGSSNLDCQKKSACLSTDDHTSLTDWHLGFHIFLESSEFQKRSFECAVDSIHMLFPLVIFGRHFKNISF